MKTFLKIVIGLLSLMLVVFVSAGLIVPEVKYKTSTTINQPLEIVWEKFNDLDQLHYWIPEVIEVKVVKENPGIVGSEYEMTVESQGSKITMVETVTEFEPMKRVGHEFDAGDMLKKSTYHFSADEGNTTILAQHVCRGQNFIHRCLFAFFKTMFKNIDEKYMQQFKSYVEG